MGKKLFKPRARFVFVSSGSALHNFSVLLCCEAFIKAALEKGWYVAKICWLLVQNNLFYFTQFD